MAETAAPNPGQSRSAGTTPASRPRGARQLSRTGPGAGGCSCPRHKPRLPGCTELSACLASTAHQHHRNPRYPQGMLPVPNQPSNSDGTAANSLGQQQDRESQRGERDSPGIPGIELLPPPPPSVILIALHWMFTKGNLLPPGLQREGSSPSLRVGPSQGTSGRTEPGALPAIPESGRPERIRSSEQSQREYLQSS